MARRKMVASQLKIVIPEALQATYDMLNAMEQ